MRDKKQNKKKRSRARDHYQKIVARVEIGMRDCPRNNDIYYYGLRCSGAFFANVQMSVHDYYL